MYEGHLLRLTLFLIEPLFGEASLKLKFISSLSGGVCRGLVSAPAAVAVCLSQPGVSYTIHGQMAPLKLGVGDIKQATFLE